ncbi:MAG: Gfo/Idh/MocA family oxidoreductase [Candidatus Hydrogenedentes bacterium]|nr:Gfo/Idh/MocA family oxidoreductase [Candidatus Hydrogenedentota bacterium]NLT59433.1 Gfo/Idh/MocA family oxidoreductase [Candidatus Hydrogenedentota bacterium]
MNTIRVGFVGLGGICRSRHVPGLRRLDGVDIVAVANRTRESSERAAAQFGIPEVCDSWQQIVERDDIDAVFIGTWPYLHKDVSIAALNSGKHVFCQARMARDLGEARAMHEAAQRSGRVAALCPVPIGLSVDATIARLLREDALGDIRLVRVQSFSDAFARPETPLHWRNDDRLSGLNMHTLGMYAEVIHRWFGWTWTVHAIAQTFTRTRLDAAGQPARVNIPDQVLFTAGMRAGFLVQYTISAAVHHGEEEIQIFGSEGSLVYDVNDDALYGARAGEPLAPVEMRPGEACDLRDWPVEHDFIRAIRDGAEYHPDFLDGLKYMQVVQAVHDSAREGKTVMLD